MHASSTSTLRPQNDTDVTCYKCNVHLPILIFFGRNVAQEKSYKITFNFPPQLTNAYAQHHSIIEFCILSEPSQ